MAIVGTEEEEKHIFGSGYEAESCTKPSRELKQRELRDRILNQGVWVMSSRPPWEGQQEMLVTRET